MSRPQADAAAAPVAVTVVWSGKERTSPVKARLRATWIEIVTFSAPWPRFVTSTEKTAFVQTGDASGAVASGARGL